MFSGFLPILVLISALRSPLSVPNFSLIRVHVCTLCRFCKVFEKPRKQTKKKTPKLWSFVSRKWLGRFSSNSVYVLPYRAGTSTARKDYCGVPTLQKDGLRHVDNQAKASILNQYFSSVFTNDEHLRPLADMGPSPMADPGWGIWGKCPPPPPFKKLHTRSRYSNRAVNYSNKAVTMFMRQCSLPMKL